MNIKYDGLEIRSGEGGKRYVSGLIPFDSMSEDLGGFREIIRKGAFTKTLQESDVRALWAHDTRYVIGRSKIGTFTLEERSDGLFVEAELPNTTWANDLAESVSRRDVPGMSFGFRAIKDVWTAGASGTSDLRELLEVQLFEVSFGVAFPAYPESDSVVSARDWFRAAGADEDTVSIVLAKRESDPDYKLSDRESDSIRSMIRGLTGLLGESESGRSRENDGEEREEPGDKPTTRARRLALLEFETGIPK
jgi:HK97 family phage prohead protease